MKEKHGTNKNVHNSGGDKKYEDREKMAGEYSGSETNYSSHSYGSSLLYKRVNFKRILILKTYT